MFIEKVGLSLEKIQSMDTASFEEVVQVQKMAEHWTAAKKIHAAERGRLDKNRYEIAEECRTLIFQANFSKSE